MLCFNMLVIKNPHTLRDAYVLNPFTLFRQISAINIKYASNLNDLNESENSVDDSARFSEDEIANKRNKSRLKFRDRERLLGEVRFPPHSDNRIYYMRKLYGLHGDKSGISPSICWPTSEEILSQKEYDSLARPNTLQEMITINETIKSDQKDRIIKREKDLSMKLANLEKWKGELKARTQKREADAAAAKAKKDRLIEEVRRHFGFKVDPKDDRFKEMLEKKEREEKKLLKEEKRKAREAKLLSRLVEAASKTDDVKPATPVNRQQ